MEGEKSLDTNMDREPRLGCNASRLHLRVCPDHRCAHRYPQTDPGHTNTTQRDALLSPPQKESLTMPLLVIHLRGGKKKKRDKDLSRESARKLLSTDKQT